MKVISKIFNWIAYQLVKLGTCATAGFIVGCLAGFMLFLYQIKVGGDPVFTHHQFLQIALVLSFFSFLILLFTLYVFCRYTLASILFPCIVNSLLSTFLTVFIINHFHLWAIGFFIGALCGLMVGKLLCIICGFLNIKSYGMYRKGS